MSHDAEVLPPESSGDGPKTYRTKYGGILTPWQPGQTGNPNHIRRPESEYMQTMRIAKANSPAAMMQLVMTMNTTKDDRVRVVAANAILDRAGMHAPKVKDDEERDKPKFDLDTLSPEALTKLREVFGELAVKAEANKRAGLGRDDGLEPGVTDINPETGDPF